MSPIREKLELQLKYVPSVSKYKASHPIVRSAGEQDAKKFQNTQDVVLSKLLIFIAYH